MEFTSLENKNVPSENEKDDRKLLSKVIDTISGIFTPIIPAITAAGMMKAVLAILMTFNVISKDSQSYQVINFMADSAFYFYLYYLLILQLKSLNVTLIWQC